MTDKPTHQKEPSRPGERLARVLDDIDMTQAELAKRTGLSTKHINQIVNGAASITPETALLLEHATGVSAREWNELELAFREQLSLRDESARLSSDIDWLKELPLKELIRRGFVEQRTNQIEQVRAVCRFFGVANRAAWEALWHKPTAYRISKAFKSDPGAVAAWLRIGEVQALSVKSGPYDRAGLLGILEELRALTKDPDPQSWWPTLTHACARVGVAVVAEPEIKGARINGAARWLSPEKALVQLSLRHKWSDIFWFTFFHEIGHILLHSKKDTFINDVGVHSGVEQEADAFASQLLVPRRYEVELGELRSLRDVEHFASRLGIGPGIVVGRLQHDEQWPYNRGNELKQLLTFIDTP